MGKGEKDYITHKEWVNSFGGKTEYDNIIKHQTQIKALPFNCCSLSLQPFEDPMATSDGNIYDMLNIIPFVKKHNIDPVTGKPLTIKDLFKVHFHKNSKNEYICPILEKVFTDHSHIVMIKSSGNVYSYDAVYNLNIEPKNWIELLTDKPFKKEEIITIQDPQDKSKRNQTGFHFIKQGLKLEKDGDKLANIQLNDATSRIFDEIKKQQNNKSEKNSNATTSSGNKTLEEKEFEKFKKEKELQLEDKRKHSIDAPSFTSTGFSSTDKTKIHPADSEGLKTKKQGYVILKTNLGEITLVLYSNLVPKACQNFIGLCEEGYYNGVIFHRLIKNFMIQGGDPTGSGRGGNSLWEKPFKDEFNKELKHSERGILSMANHGPNTNGSQFFITFKECKHLDQKHTVFGRVIDGMDVLNLMEMVKVNSNDEPLTPIKILSTNILGENPFENVLLEEFQDIQQSKKDKELQNQLKQEVKGTWYSDPSAMNKPTTINNNQIGKYLSTTPTSNDSKKRPIEDEDQPQQIKKTKNSSFGNFSNW
ncbi:cyclophilin-type peptidylprolyl cis-trans isomerase [Tieghemostelium lacteum]|uniref:Cyclophilin-type peptidylprolyl cis-trans isomerase n=1 Tax=Tieghemostelium lacteum TaxID=361077 RepID=A0A151ZJD7_TIELA|nr:cyclophilin-type peptidylprolyl cis-trans isomerase [Tieghemostelium lacteum]|eukprot:KYQ94037.1 cyclophilin-type peptidylprolyl cis-trans isomerase [Tieghemostelium lacteum]